MILCFCCAFVWYSVRLKTLDVTVSKTHGTIIPRYQVHAKVFIAVFKKKQLKTLKKMRLFIIQCFCKCFSLTLLCFLCKRANDHLIFFGKEKNWTLSSDLEMTQLISCALFFILQLQVNCLLWLSFSNIFLAVLWTKQVFFFVSFFCELTVFHTQFSRSPTRGLIFPFFLPRCATTNERETKL